MSDIIYGSQLYTFRKMMTTPDRVEEVMAGVAKLGAKTVQLSGLCEMPAKRVKEIADANGLSICGTHSPFERIVNDTDALAEEHIIMGTDSVGLGMMPVKYITNADGIKRFAEIANTVCEKLKPYNLKFGYHNHSREFKRDGDRVYLDILADEVPDLQFILDTYWVKFAGEDPVKYLKKYTGRLELIHLKDYKKGKIFKKIEDVGSGTLDWKAIIDAAKKAGTKYAVIEHDTTKDPYRTTENGLNFIKTIG